LSPALSPRVEHGKRSASICPGQIKIKVEKLLPSHVFHQVALMAAKERAEYF